MHQLNVLIFGSESFTSTLDELKSFLKFNHLTSNANNDYEIILFDIEALKDKAKKEIINNSNLPKIFVSNKKNQSIACDAYLQLPTTLREINSIIENIVAKKKFSINSSIKVKEYLLDKNEKKLLKEKKAIILTEKEVQLIELFLTKSKPISKDKILSYIWNYSSDADTHTVETHIYRLRKKINAKFMDDKFIFNNKNGYYI